MKKGAWQCYLLVFILSIVPAGWRLTVPLHPSLQSLKIKGIKKFLELSLPSVARGATLSISFLTQWLTSPASISCCILALNLKGGNREQPFV